MFLSLKTLSRFGVRGSRLAMVPVLVAGALVLAGCGSGDGLDRQPISGSVTLDGTPLDTGTIRFEPSSTEATTETSAEITAGKYAFTRETGPVPGSYRVSISSVPNPNTQAKEGMVPGEFRPDTGKDRVPPQYNLQSKLTATVKSGDASAIDFALTTK